MVRKKIGLMLGDEDDWPLSFEAFHRRLNPKITYKGETFEIDLDRVRIHPFFLRERTSYNLVIDRLAYWHFNPREWLKKVAMLDKVYLLNNPFTFQSMEKHTAYCAMIRAGLNIPETMLIPAKRGPSGKKYEVTASRYHDLFDLRELAVKLGYPFFMKPFDGGGWRGVTCIKNERDLLRAYDESGESIMHLQQGLLPFEIFIRALAIGPQVMVMHYDPDRPMHGRYLVDFNFLDEKKGREAIAIVKLINAFFRWEFNSCESIIKDGVLYPIDFANACPDIAITSLHYYFPWAIAALWKWSVYCVVTGREMRINLTPQEYFDIGDSGRTYEEKLVAYEKIADRYFEKEQFDEFCAKHLSHVDGEMIEFIDSKEFDDILRLTVVNMFPPHEHEKFINHYRGLMGFWVQCMRPKPPEEVAAAKKSAVAQSAGAPAARGGGAGDAGGAGDGTGTRAAASKGATPAPGTKKP